MMAIESLRHILEPLPQYQIVWVAHNGAEAIRLCAEETPDLILMDLIMPVMGGNEATKHIMKTTPCAILVVTSYMADHSAKIFEAMGAGALDVVATPVLGRDKNTSGGKELLEKIARIGKLIGVEAEKRIEVHCSTTKTKIKPHKDCLFAIGCSTGGPKALVEILAHLPKNFPASVVVTQHMNKQFTSGLAKWIDSQTELAVGLVAEGDRPQPGVVLIASTNDHLIMNEKEALSYIPEPRNNFYRPSVDIFFTSVAENWQGNAVGILLTGMGKDGAKGLLALHDKGCYTIAQDKATSVVYGMPKAAVELNAASMVLPVDRIGPACIELFAPKVGACDE